MRFAMRNVIRDVTKNRPVRQIGISQKVVDIMAKAKAVGVEILLPVDSKTWCFANGICRTSIVDCNDDPLPGGMEMDCGPATRLIHKHAIQGAKTIIWNGPMGQYETKVYEMGSKNVMEQVIEATAKGSRSIVMGLDTVAMFKAHGCEDKVTHYTVHSTAGWNLLLDKQLRGVETLSGAGVCVCGPLAMDGWLLPKNCIRL